MNEDNKQASQPDLLLTLNFHDSSMMLNEGILDALGRPRQVQILINEEARRLLMRPCELDSEQAVVIPAGRVMQVEIGGRSLLRKIRRIAGWETDQPRICVGAPIPEYHAICFDLEDAVAVNVQPPGLTKARESDGNPDGAYSE